jgi:hypothetical protein
MFLAEHYNYNGDKVSHYFYCIYSQENDKNNGLFRDIVGLLITTKPPVGYNSQVTINGKEAYVCCDKEERFISETNAVTYKHQTFSKTERKNVIKVYKSFRKEIERQLKGKPRT